MENKLGVSAIIPCHNEKERISEVLTAVSYAKLLDETIVVDDGSSDGSADFIEKRFPEVKIIRNENNLGKAGAIVRGVQESRNPIIVFIDADLTNFHGEHVDNLVRPLVKGEADMAVQCRMSAPWVYRKVFHSDPTLSGERALLKKDFLEVLNLNPEFGSSGYAMEVIINQYFIDLEKRIVVIPAYGVDQHYKEQKEGFFKGFGKNLNMTEELFNQAGTIKFLKQLYYFSQLPYTLPDQV